MKQLLKNSKSNAVQEMAHFIPNNRYGCVRFYVFYSPLQHHLLFTMHHKFQTRKHRYTEIHKKMVLCTGLKTVIEHIGGYTYSESRFSMQISSKNGINILNFGCKCKSSISCIGMNSRHSRFVSNYKVIFLLLMLRR